MDRKSVYTATEVLQGFDDAARRRIAALRAQGHFFWLDASLAETVLDDLGDALSLPERAASALRTAVDAKATRTVVADEDFVHLVLRCHAERDGSPPFAVHVLVTSGYLLTLHEERLSLPAMLGVEPDERRGKGYAVYAVLDAMLSTKLAALEEVELRLDALATGWTDGRGALPKAALTDSVATLATMRRWLTAEQAVLERAAVELVALPGFGPGAAPDLDRLVAQADRLLASVDAAASGLGMLVDLQLNERAYVVSVLATIFVPLTLITGYFGMNFGWLVDRIDSPVAFWILGVGVPVATGILSWRLLVRPFVLGDRERVRPAHRSPPARRQGR